MATVSKSIRVADDRAEQFEAIKNEFNSGAEFGDWIIEAFRMHQATRTEEAFSTDAKELEGLFKRVINIFNNAAERTESALKNKDASIKETIDIKEIKIEELGEEIGSLQEQIKQLNDELKAREDIIKEKDKVIRDTQKILDKSVEDLQTTKDLNKMLQEKESHYIKVEELNETLVKEVDQLNEAHQKEVKELNETYQEEVKGLNVQLNEAVRNVENTKVQLDKVQQEIIRKDKEIEDTIEKYTDKINALKEANVDKIQGLKDSHEVAIDKITVTKDMEINQLKVQVQQAKVDAAEEAQKREKQLLGELEDLRKEIHQLKVSSVVTPAKSK